MNGFFCILLLILSGNAFASNSLSTILLIGDSLSTAYELDASITWSTLLTKRLQENNLPYQLVNISSPADTTDNSLEKLPKALEQYHPDIVIIAVGGNDGLRGVQPKHIEKNLSKLIELSQNIQAKVMVISFLIPTNYGPYYQTKHQEIFRNAIEKYHITQSVMFSNDQPLHLIKNDNLHPTPEGQPIIVDALWPKLLALIEEPTS